MNKTEIGQAIAEARKAQGITIRKMAELANTSPRAIQAVEKGWYNVGIETYLKLAETLNISIKVGEWPTTPLNKNKPSHAKCGGLLYICYIAQYSRLGNKGENSGKFPLIGKIQPNKSSKTFLFASSTFLRSGTM